MNRLVSRGALPILAFFLGVLFAVGLSLSSMTRPDKIVGFLDFAGAWDPSLAFVMGGAVVLFGLTYRLSGRRAGGRSLRALFPTRRDIDTPLLVGAALFGLGWGLAGFCPGPAIVSLATGSLRVWLFVAAMLAGIQLGNLLEAARSKSTRL